MSPEAIAVLGFVALFVLMVLRVPIGIAMGMVGVRASPRCRALSRR